MTTVSAGGSGTSSSSVDNSRPLNNEAVFRIELSLSSRKSSVIVMRCTARLYSLEGVKQDDAPDNQGDAEWKSIAYGAPCIQLMRETTEHNSPFHIKLIIAEVESGIGLWECQLDKGSKYNAMQNNFQTFSLQGKPHAIQFANDSEACRMLESVQDLLYQQEKLETVNLESKRGGGGGDLIRKTKSLKKLSKKDISAPCNFKHVSGITLQRTRTCEDELRGTIQRKLRTMSLSSLVSRRSKQRPQSEVIKRDHHRDDDIQELEESPKVIKRGVDSDGKSSRSLRARLSMRSSKKKQQQHTPLKITEVRDDSALSNNRPFVRHADNRRSLPSRGRKHSREGLNKETFVKPSDDEDFIFVPLNSKPLSLSSGNLASSTMTQSHDQLSRQPPSAGADKNPHNTIERRHTMMGGKSSSSYNYTPYSASVDKPSRPKYATLDNRHSNPHLQQQQHQVQHQQPQANGGRGDGALGGFNDRQYMSDMSLHRNHATKMRSHSTQQLNRNWGGAAGGGAGHGNYPQRSSYHEAQVPSTLHEVPLTNQVDGSMWNGSGTAYHNQHHLAAQSIPEIPHQNGYPPSHRRSQELASGRSQELIVNGRGQEVRSRLRSQDSMNGRSQESINRRSLNGNILAQNGVQYQIPPIDTPPSTLSPRGGVSHSSVHAPTTNNRVVPPTPSGPITPGHTHNDLIRMQQQVRNNVPPSSFGVHGSSYPSRGSRNQAEPEMFDLLAPRETTPTNLSHNTSTSPVRGSDSNILPPQANKPPTPSITTPAVAAQVPYMSSYHHLNSRSNAPRPVPVQVAIPRIPPMQAQQQQQQQQQHQHHQQHHQQYQQQYQQYHQEQMVHSQFQNQSNWNSNVPNPHAQQSMVMRQQPNHAQSDHARYYPRGYTATMTTAAEQIRADTHVSPSHSHSQVSPLQLQGQIENGVVHQAFNNNPDPIPVPVGVTAVPLLSNQLHEARELITKSEDHSNHHHPSNSSYDGTDSLASQSSSSISTTEAYTDKMSKALEQFGSLLTKESSMMQTTF